MDEHWTHDIPKHIAENIRDIISAITGENVQVFGNDGYIIATTQPERLGTLHEGAAKIIRGEIAYAAITEEDAKTMQGVRPGYSTPIVFNSKRVGAIGISGSPDIMKPYAEMAAEFAIQSVQSYNNEQKTKAVFNETSSEIDDLTKTIQNMQVLIEEVAGRGQGMLKYSQDVSKELKSINEFVTTVNTITRQSKLLGLNASIEAARAGEHGRGFTLVAEEVVKLSEQSSNAAQEIGSIISSINGVITDIETGIKQNAQITSDQSESFRAIVTKIENIKKQIDMLVK